MLLISTAHSFNYPLKCFDICAINFHLGLIDKLQLGSVIDLGFAICSDGR